MRRACPPSLPVGVAGGGMVDGPGIAPATGAGGQARHHHIRGLVEGIFGQGFRAGDITEPHLGSLQILDHLLSVLLAAHAAAVPSEGHHLIAALHKFLDHEASDVARCSEHHHAHLFRWSAAEVMTQSHGARDWTTGRN